MLGFQFSSLWDIVIYLFILRSLLNSREDHTLGARPGQFPLKGLSRRRDPAGGESGVQRPHLNSFTAQSRSPALHGQRAQTTLEVHPAMYPRSLPWRKAAQRRPEVCSSPWHPEPSPCPGHAQTSSSEQDTGRWQHLLQRQQTFY